MSSERLVKLALVGGGAFGIKHLEALRKIDGVQVVSLTGRQLEPTVALGQKYGIRNVGIRLEDVLAMSDVEGVLLCTPSPLHASQAMACIRAGKHVQVEIPLATCGADAESLAQAQRKSGLVVMGGHTRRFNPSHEYVHRRVVAGEFSLLHLNVETYFFRRTNANALGQARSWTDHLLWHHAAHTIDLFAHQCGSPVIQANALQGPIHPTLGIAMDMAIQLRARNGAVCSLSLSFNNEGPLGSTFRYIGDSATYVARYDDLFDGNGDRIALSEFASSGDGVERQDREFVSAIREGRAPHSSAIDVLPCYQTIQQLQQQLETAT